MNLSYINPFALKPQPLSTISRTPDEIQITTGKPFGRFGGLVRYLNTIPTKLLLWNANMGSGNVSEEIKDKVRAYLHINNLHDVAVSIDEYNPKLIWSRVFSNPNTSLFSKATFGVATGLFYTFSIPKLIGLDVYLPGANAVVLNSNIEAVALHECGHAKDFNERKNPSLYLMTGYLADNLASYCEVSIPTSISSLVTLYHEYKATDNALEYLKSMKASPAISEALKILTPAYFSYIGAAVPTLKFTPSPVPLLLDGFLQQTLFIAAGHVFGRCLALRIQENVQTSAEPENTLKATSSK